MASRDDQRKIRERGALIVRWHVREIIDPSRLVLKRNDSLHRWPYLLCLNGDFGKDVCYIAVGQEDTLVSFQVEYGKGTYRKYGTFGEAERDTGFKEELLGRVKDLIGKGGKE